MRIHLIPMALGTCLVALGIAQPAMAQGTEKGDVSLGYQFMNLSSAGESQALPVGWFADVAGNLTRSMAVVGQVSGSYKSLSQSASLGGLSASATADIKMHQFMGGIRLSSRANPTVVPFGHILAGANYGSVSFSGSGNIAGQAFSVNGAQSGTNFALQAGGGASVGITSALGIRFGVDYLRVFSKDGGANAFRFGAGVSIKL